MRKSLLLLLLPAMLCTSVLAQPSAVSDLEKRRAAIQKEIDDVKSSLNETSKDRKESLGQLRLIQKKLSLRQQQISTINQQINLIQGDITNSSRDISKLKKELDTLRIQYEKSIVYAYKNGSNYAFVNFLFSSTSFNDALKRITYLRSYRTYREQQAENITNTQNLLEGKIAGLNRNRQIKAVVLSEETRQKSLLEEEKQERNTVVAKLKSREKELTKELAAKTKQNLKLKAAITAAINRAIADAKKKSDLALKTAGPEGAKTTGAATGTGSKNIETKTAAASRPESIFDADPLAKKLSEDFENNRGRLPWPLESGRISMGFGRQNVEGLANVSFTNYGITIATVPGKSVKAVFDGEVSVVTPVGPGECVIVKHGKYFTSYSNLTGVAVSKGQKIKTGQTIGRAADMGNESAEVEFIISDEKNQNFDPEKWLRK